MERKPSRPLGGDGALPWIDAFPARGILLHGILAAALIGALDWLVVTWVPFQIRVLRESYLIFFYHFPAALNMLVFYTSVMLASIAFLVNKAPAWDRRARAAAEVGLLANAIVLVTGSTWAKVAWGHFWIWTDPRLLSAAVMTLTYLGYLVIQTQIEEPARRRTVAAIYGIVASVNVPMVHMAIKWFGSQSHPMKLESDSDREIQATRWFGVLAFLVLYLLLYRWRYDRLFLSERSEGLLHRVRNLEEGRLST